MKKKHILTTIVLLGIIPSSYADFSGTITAASDYIWRGISQTQHNPAIQGTINYDFSDTGFYLSLFGSNVDFGEDSSAHTEVDYIAGYSHDFNEDWNIDLGGMEYTYFNASDNNYLEGYFNLGYKFLTANFAYSANTFNTGTDGYYYGLTAKHQLFKNSTSELLKKVYLQGHLGYFQKNSDVDGGSYLDHSLTLSKEMGYFTAELGYSNTSGRDANDDLGDRRIYVALSLNLGKTEDEENKSDN